MKPIKILLTTLSNRIRFLSSNLGQVPALLYFSGYVVVIFVFSLIYYYALSGNDFYDSTNQYDFGSFNNETNKVLHDLRRDIIQAYQKNGEAEQAINGWQMEINNLDVDSLYVGNLPSEFSFQIIIPINNGTEGNGDSLAFIATKITVFTKGKFISDGIVYAPFQFGETFTPNLQGIPGQIPTPGMLFNYDLSNYQKGSLPVLPLSLNLYNRIVEVGQGFKGFLPKVNGHYSRMLYFSTGIATSSALGEIVPVSTQARLSVTSETIIAAIFIGLFLNSLAYDISKASKNTDKIDKKTNRMISKSNKKRPT